MPDSKVKFNAFIEQWNLQYNLVVHHSIVHRTTNRDSFAMHHPRITPGMISGNLLRTPWHHVISYSYTRRSLLLPHSISNNNIICCPKLCVHENGKFSQKWRIIYHTLYILLRCTPFTSEAIAIQIFCHNKRLNHYTMPNMKFKLISAVPRIPFMRENKIYSVIELIYTFIRFECISTSLNLLYRQFLIDDYRELLNIIPWL